MGRGGPEVDHLDRWSVSREGWLALAAVADLNSAYCSVHAAVPFDCSNGCLHNEEDAEVLVEELLRTHLTEIAGKNCAEKPYEEGAEEAVAHRSAKFSDFGYRMVWEAAAEAAAPLAKRLGLAYLLIFRALAAMVVSEGVHRYLGAWVFALVSILVWQLPEAPAQIHLAL